MNKPQIIEGIWWIHGKDKPAHFGILNYDPESGFELSVQIPQARSTDESLLAMLTGAEDEEVANVIHGTNENAHPVTLFECRIRDFTKGAGMDSYRVHVSAAILNDHVDTWDNAQYPAVGVEFNLLTQWLNQKFFIHDEQRAKDAINRRSFLFEFQLHDVLEFVVSPEATIKIQCSPIPSREANKFKLEQSHTLYFIFSKPFTIQQIYDDYVNVFLRLLSLLTGERIFIEKFTLLSRDPFLPNQTEHFKDCELLFPNRGVSDAKNDVHAGHMVVGYESLAQNFGEILKKWFECHERLEPVLDLYSAVIGNLILMDKSRFLLLAQAMEVYHARSGFPGTGMSKESFQQRVNAVVETAPEAEKEWLEEKLRYANQKTLAQRLTDIVELHRAEVERLTISIPDFTTKVRNTRNYYTHYDQKMWTDGKVADGLELKRIIHALVCLLEVCLLKELGIKGKPISEVLNRYAQIEWFDLTLKVEDSAESAPQRQTIVKSTLII